MTTKTDFNRIMQSSLFRLNGPEIDLCAAINAEESAKKQPQEKGGEE